MASLADELAADLFEQDSAEKDLTEFTAENVENKAQFDINSVAIRARSKEWTCIIQDIEYHNSRNNKLSAEDEYETIVSANMMAQEIDDEMRIVVKFIRDKYAKRFPELEGLILNHLDYAKAVKNIGNDMDLTDTKLELPSATAIVVVVAASDTKGQPLTSEELRSIFEGCDTVFLLENMRKSVLEYVKSRITLIAPNLTNVVGSTTAANLIGFAGGLTNLSRIPACNLAAPGTSRQQSIGLSTGIGVRSQGFLYHSELMQNVPPNFRKQIQRVVAGKIALATRLDAMRESTDGSMGSLFRQQIEEKIEKVLEPPTKNSIKALSRPDEKPKKKRAGKRVQQMKGQYAMTELRKQQNRIVFGEQEEEYGFGEETEGLGLLGQKNSGSIRASTVDERTKLKLSKNRKLQLLGQQKPFGLSSQIGGMQSSLAFSTHQGLELVNPVANQQKDEKDNWFKTGLYSQIKK